MKSAIAALLITAAALPAARAQDAQVVGWTLETVGVQRNSVTLSWPVPSADSGYSDPVAYELRYRVGTPPPSNWMLDVEIWDAPDSIVVPLPAPDPAHSDETVIVAGLQPATTYYFAIRIPMEGGTVLAVAEAEATTAPPDTTAPDAPVLLTAVAEGSSIRISWSAAADDAGDPASGPVPGNTVAVVKASAGVAITGATFDGLAHDEAGASLAPGTILFHVIGGLQPDTLYRVALRSTDAAGNPGPVSNTLEARTAPAPASTGTPRRCGGSAQGGALFLAFILIAAIPARGR